MRHIVRQLLLLLSIVQQLFMCIIPETEILLRNICIIQQNILLDFFVKKYCKGHKLTEDDREYITCFYSYSIVGIVSRWIGEGMPPYDKDLIKRFSESFDATIDTMINLCEANN